MGCALFAMALKWATATEVSGSDDFEVGGVVLEKRGDEGSGEREERCGASDDFKKGGG